MSEQQERQWGWGRRLTGGPLAMTWYSISVRLSKGLLVLPVATIALSPTDLALWLLLLVVVEFSQQAEMGLGPTLLRATAYFLAGAETLAANDTALDSAANGEARRPNLTAIANLVSTGQVIYHVICLLAAPVLLGVATFASWGFLAADEFGTGPCLAILTTVLIIVIRLQSVLWVSVLQGFGRVADANYADGSVNIGVTVLQIAALSVGFGVLGIMVVQMLGWLTLYAWTRRMCMSSLRELGADTTLGRVDRQLIKQIWPLTWQLGLTMLGSFLLVNGPSFFASQLAPAAVAAGYLLCMRLLTINRGLAGAFVLAEMPRAIRMSALREVEPLRQFAAKRIAASNGLFLLGLVFLLVAGNFLLSLIGANAHFLDVGPFLLLGLSSLLSAHMSDHLLLYVTSNRVPFWRTFLVAGVVTVAGTALLVPTYGLMAVIGVRLAVTAIGVAWYPVALNLRYLEWRWRDYWLDVPAAGLGVLRDKLARWWP